MQPYSGQTSNAHSLHRQHDQPLQYGLGSAEHNSSLDELQGETFQLLVQIAQKLIHTVVYWGVEGWPNAATSRQSNDT
jgi:hypothetical protein